MLTPGVVRRQISVTLINDQNIEKNETFAIRLANFGDSRINLGDINRTMILILDDDGEL